MAEFPTELPIEDCKTIINAVRAEGNQRSLPPQAPKGQLVLAIWNVQGFVLNQLCGTPTLTIGVQTTTDPVAALGAAVQAATHGIPVKEANVPWTSIASWLSDMTKLVSKG
jgi:hypothetical protein